MCLDVERKPSLVLQRTKVTSFRSMHQLPSIQLTRGSSQLQLTSRKGKRQPNSLQLKFIMGNFDKVNHAKRNIHHNHKCSR